MNNLVSQFAQACLIYDEKNFKKKLLNLLPVTSYKEFMNGTDFYAFYVINGVMNISIRGTDGTNLVRWLEAWLRDFDFTPDGDGMHPGFRFSAEAIKEEFLDYSKPYIFNRIEVKGHSGGAGIDPILGLLLSSNFGVPIECYSFASPPSFNAAGAALLNEAHKVCGLANNRITNPRDIVTMVCRHGHDEHKRGVDVGSNFEIPPDTWFQKVFKGVFSVCEHSPREYCDGLIVYFKKSGDLVAVDDLKKIRKLLVC
jgi:hypothetical protein